MGGEATPPSLSWSPPPPPPPPAPSRGTFPTPQRRSGLMGSANDTGAMLLSRPPPLFNGPPVCPPGPRLTLSELHGRRRGGMGGMGGVGGGGGGGGLFDSQANTGHTRRWGGRGDALIMLDAGRMGNFLVAAA